MAIPSGGEKAWAMSDREKKKRKKEKLHEMVGYTNDNNPFGDADLGRKFTWKKKDAASRRCSEFVNFVSLCCSMSEETRARRVALNQNPRDRPV